MSEEDPNDSLKKCRHCGHFKMEHFATATRLYCLRVGGCPCPGFAYEEVAPAKPLMFSVRIDMDGEKYTFQVEPMEWCPELIALDSTPGVIAFVEAPNPGAAAARAWEKGEKELAALDGLTPSPPEKLLELLGDKK